MSTLIKILIIIPLILWAPDLLSQASLNIDITNIRSEKGSILISVFDNEDQFPRKAKPEFKDLSISKKDIKNGKLTYKLDKLSPGKYAIALLDDENNSGDMDNNGLGLPQEGFGFSNNIRPLFSAPPYRKCLFEIKEGKNNISIKVRYR